jgi:peptidoglycan/LPS O-acetylase OafA/YrhL
MSRVAHRSPGSTNGTVVALRPPSRRRRQRRLAAVGLGLALLGAGVAAMALAAASSRKMKQVLGAYVGCWVAVMGGLKLLRGSPRSRRLDRAGPGPGRPSGRSVDDGAA